jgi:hypothetical protein
MTAQFSDQIRYKRRFYSLFSEPLEDYFNEQHPKPEAYRANDCSACWRGYIAYWAIKRGKLFLEYISPWDGPNPDPAIGETMDDAYRRHMSETFPGATTPLFAEWYSGTLRLVRGEMLEYVHMGYDSTFETEIVLQVVAGKVLEDAK